MYLATGHGDNCALEFSWLCAECKSLISKSALIIKVFREIGFKHLSVMIPL